MADKPFTVEAIADGQYRLQIEVTSLVHLKSLIPHIVAMTGISEEKLREQLASAPFTDTQTRPGTIDFNLSFGGDGVMRAVTKACMLLWARKIGNEELQRPEYDEARRFVVKGSAGFTTARTSLDSRTIPNSAAVQAVYGPLFNLIYVASDVSGRVVGHFTAYNLLGFQVVLAESGGLPQAKAALASDPLDPKVWSDRADEVVNLDTNWLNAPGLNIEEYRSRNVEMLTAYYEVMGSRAVAR